MLNATLAATAKKQYTEKVKNPYTGKIETVTQDRPFNEADFDEIFALFDQEHQAFAGAKASGKGVALEDDSVVGKQRFLKLGAFSSQKPAPMTYEQKLALANENRNTLGGNSPSEKKFLQADEDQYLKPVKDFNKMVNPIIGDAILKAHPFVAGASAVLKKANPELHKKVQEFAGSAGNPLEQGVQVASGDPIALMLAPLGIEGAKPGIKAILSRFAKGEIADKVAVKLLTEEGIDAAKARSAIANQYKADKEAATVVKAKAKPVEVKPVQEATGLANQVNVREKEAGILKTIPKAKGKSPEELQAIGKKAFGDDYDYESLAERIAKGEESPSAEKFGILLEGKRRLSADVNNAAAKMAADPKNKTLKHTFEQAQDRLQSYVDNVQVGKGEWSDMGRALQAGATLDEGDFASVLLHAERRGGKPSEKWVAENQKLVDEIAKRDEEIAKLKAGQTTVRTARTKMSVDSIKKEIDDIGAEWEKLNATKTKGGKSTKQTGAILVTRDDIAKLGKRGELVVRYVKAHAKLGAATVEEFLQNLKVSMLEKLGVQIDDNLAINLAAEVKERPARSDLLKQNAALKSKLKQASTEGQDKRIAELEAQIAENKRRIDEGDFGVPTKAERVVSERVKAVQSERDIWASRVRKNLQDHEDGWGKKVGLGLAKGVRGTQLGSDLGNLTRQGLFAFSRPVALAKGTRDAALSMFSEKNLARIERELDERVINGQKAIVTEKEIGLQRTSHFGGINQQEEFSLGKLGEIFPEYLGRGLKKIKLEKMGGFVQKAGKTLGGSLGRAQSAFINTIRANTIDRAIARGYSKEELIARARFINNATGRGNIKSVPTAAQVIFTSPRYEASRWAMLAEPLWNPGRLAADLAKGRGWNRGAAANMQDLIVTSAEVFGVYKLAELAGYQVDFDPKSADFLKMRRGNEVWDPTAGMAPRIRDVMRVAMFWRDPDYKQTIQDVGVKTLFRTISPTIKTPIEQGSYAVQKFVDKKTELKSPFTGFVEPEDEQGLMAFAPLIGQTFWKTLKEDSPEAAWNAALKEFFGQSINRYPKKN